MSLPEQIIRPIGGYFELELPRNMVVPHRKAKRFQSARSAFLALLRAGTPKRVWLPRYICDAMLAPLHAANIECEWYDLDGNLTVDNSINIGPDDWLLYVNYFGLCNNNVGELLQHFPPNQIVLDFSQSFFDPPVEKALATIYSPRKFFGVPDGGLLANQTFEISTKTQDAGSLGRASHLMKRLADSPEVGYSDYQHAEESLSDCEPKRMSKLTERILTSIDFDNVRNKRHGNFMLLHKELSGSNSFDIDTVGMTAPLCYPFVTNNQGLRKRLIANRIFVPTYWPDATERVGERWAERMVRNLLPLPIDQRYGREDMERIVSIILDRNS
jgi:hypothetical protein